MRLSRLQGESRGFTVIEMLVVMAVIALLLSVVAPAYIRRVDNARETALKQDLATMRDAIDKFYTDQARYPSDLVELVGMKYLKTLPVDPMTNRSDTWITTPNASPGSSTSSVQDVHSGASGVGLDRTAYASW